MESTFRHFTDVRVSEAYRAQVSEERAARPSEFKDPEVNKLGTITPGQHQSLDKFRNQPGVYSFKDKE